MRDQSSRDQGKAAHVVAAIETSLKSQGTPQQRGAAGIQRRVAAPHVAAALAQRAATSLQRQASAAPAAHVTAAITRAQGAAGNVQRQTSAAPRENEFVTYSDLKSPNAPPPPPRWPVYRLRCEDGENCSIEDVKTGRVHPAGDLYAGFVRMSRGGSIYLSPRPAVGVAGDSHPSIASMTPVERTGRSKLVAAGEIGILKGTIVGHNDKTGHYQTRKNRRQSGLPPEKFHPFTEDPHEWYKGG